MEEEIQIESQLKHLLEIILRYFENFIESSSDLKQIEDKLEDYESIGQLINLIENVFTALTHKIETHINSKSMKEVGYLNLEKFAQKLEAEVRNHISVE